MTIKPNLPIFAYGKGGQTPAQQAERALRAFQERSQLQPWTAQEEEAAIGEFLAWGRRAGLETGASRYIDDAGAMCFQFEIVTGRGKITGTGVHPYYWREWVVAVGLA